MSRDRSVEASEPRKRNFTIVVTGWLLLLSGVWSLLSLGSPVVLFGGLREGAVAVLYNALFAGLYAAMGVALAWRKPWALSITYATSIAYTFDKLTFMLDSGAGALALGDIGSSLGELGPLLEQVLLLMSLLFLLSWWAFVFYLYLKRDYFRATAA